MMATGFYLHCAGVPRLVVKSTVTSASWLDFIDLADPRDIQLSIHVPCNRLRLERAVAAFNAVMQDASEKDAAE